MNFEEKTGQNQFLPILFETQKQNLKKSARIFQVGVHFHPDHTATGHISVRWNIHFINTGTLLLYFQHHTHLRYLALHIHAKLDDTTPG